MLDFHPWSAQRSLLSADQDRTTRLPQGERKLRVWALLKCRTQEDLSVPNKLNWRTSLTGGQLLLALGVCHLLFSLFINTPGYLTYDSGTYHWMVKTFASTGSFFVSNGYEEFPSRALATGQLRIHSGKLVAQYPEFQTFLSYPFYLAFGYRGLFIVNALAFLGINAVIFRLSLALFDSRRGAYMAAGIYSLGTFAWEYSQSSYPHLLSTFFVVLALFFVARTLGRPTSRKTLGLAFCAGMAESIAFGIRFDAAFAAIAIVLPFLFVRPMRIAETLSAIAGATPAIVLLGWINLVKFGSANPLSYGTTGRAYHADLSWYLPVAILVAVLVAGSLIWQRLPRRPSPGAGLLIAALLTLPALAYAEARWAFASKLVGGAYQIVVDLRIRDLDIEEPALTRSSGGAMIYLEHVKKSLLQSCPYLSILAFSVFDVCRKRKHFAKLLFLLIAPATFIGFYSYLAWHGSIALNMRYLNPILPCTSILCARVWVGLAADVRWSIAARWFTFSFTLLFCAFILVSRSLDLQEAFFLTAPLILALAIVAVEAGRRFRILTGCRRAVVYLLLVAFAWSGALTFANDYPTSAGHRRHHLTESQKLLPFIRHDSLVVSTIPDVCWGLLDKIERLRIANPRADRYRSFQQLVSFHLAAGRPVYLAYPPDGFADAMDENKLAPFHLVLLKSWTTLVALQIIPPGSLAGPAPVEAAEGTVEGTVEPTKP